MEKIDRCSKCKKLGYCYSNGVSLCITHFVQEYYSANKYCLEHYLDGLIEDLEKGRKLLKKEKALLKEIKKQCPDIAEDFPIFFKQLKSSPNKSTQATSQKLGA